MAALGYSTDEEQGHSEVHPPPDLCVCVCVVALCVCVWLLCVLVALSMMYQRMVHIPTLTCVPL